jgi:prepilin-type N-terminal cleavage/methylation domain-containing protein
MGFRMVRRRSPRISGEGGFTLPEVLIVIVIMGILFGIATSTWFRVVESRAVDSATNQMVSDLRLAHTGATNRLTPWQVVLTQDSPSYQMGPSGGTPETRTLPEGTKVAGGISSIQFSPDGRAQLTGTGNVVVAADDGAPSNEIEVNAVTSRIRVVD